MCYAVLSTSPQEQKGEKIRGKYGERKNVSECVNIRNYALNSCVIQTSWIMECCSTVPCALCVLCTFLLSMDRYLMFCIFSNLYLLLQQVIVPAVPKVISHIFEAIESVVHLHFKFQVLEIYIISDDRMANT